MGGRPFAVPRGRRWSSSSPGTAGTRSRPARPTEAPRASPAEAAAALAAFVEAVEARDAQALAQLAPPRLPAADELLSGIAANVRSLDLAAVDARYVDQVGTVAPDGSWSGVAELTWRVRGFDEAPARSDVVVSFAPEWRGAGHRGVRGVRRSGDAPAAVAPWPAVGRPVGRRPGDGRRAPERRRGRGRTSGAGHRRRTARPAGLAARPSWSRCPPAQPPRRDPGRATRDVRRDRCGDRPGRTSLGRRRAGPRVREPRRHRRAAPRGRAGRDEPRAGPCRDRRGAHAGRAVAARGLRRLRRAPWHAPAGPRHPGTGHRGGAGATAYRTRCRPRRTSTPGRATCRPATRRRGWPAGSSPSGWGSEGLVARVRRGCARASRSDGALRRAGLDAARADATLWQDAPAGGCRLSVHRRNCTEGDRVRSPSVCVHGGAATQSADPTRAQPVTLRRAVRDSTSMTSARDTGEEVADGACRRR